MAAPARGAATSGGAQITTTTSGRLSTISGLSSSNVGNIVCVAMMDGGTLATGYTVTPTNCTIGGSLAGSNTGIVIGPTATYDDATNNLHIKFWYFKILTVSGSGSIAFTLSGTAGTNHREAAILVAPPTNFVFRGGNASDANPQEALDDTQSATFGAATQPSLNLHGGSGSAYVNNCAVFAVFQRTASASGYTYDMDGSGGFETTTSSNGIGGGGCLLSGTSGVADFVDAYFDTTGTGTKVVESGTSGTKALMSVILKLDQTSQSTTLTDTVGVTDSLTNPGVYGRTLTNSVDIIETSFSVHLVLVRTLSNSVGVTDSMTEHTVQSRTLTNSVDITDVVNTPGNFRFPETVGVTNTLTKSVVKAVTLTETVGVTDVLSAVSTHPRTLTDVVGITDSLTRVLGKFRTLTDTVGITNTLNPIVDIGYVLDLNRTVHIPIDEPVNNFGITDGSVSVTAKKAFTDDVGDIRIGFEIGSNRYLVSDWMPLTDTLTTYTIPFHTIISDSTQVYVFWDTRSPTGDMLSPVITGVSFDYIPMQVNEVGVTDLISIFVFHNPDFTATFTEIVGITDTVVVRRALNRPLTETVGITETFQAHAQFHRTLTNTVGVADTLSTQGIFKAVLGDIVGITDSRFKGNGSGFFAMM